MGELIIELVLMICCCVLVMKQADIRMVIYACTIYLAVVTRHSRKR